MAVKRRYHLRLPFWVYIALSVLVAMAAANLADNLLFWVFGAMASGLLLSGLVSGIMMTGLSVRRITPALGVAGEPMVVRYRITNRNRLFPVFNIRCEERPVSGRAAWNRLMPAAGAWIMHIGPRETVHGEAVFWPTRRGDARFERLRISTTFPFGLIGKSITLSQPQHTLVQPPLYKLRRGVLEAVAPAGTVGTNITGHAGAGDDYYGLREFRPGDSMRHIAWKRTANRDTLLSIERTQAVPPRLRVILNVSRPAQGADARELEERACSLVASIVHAADLAGYEVGLTVLGVDQEPLPVRRSHWHRNMIMAALAAIDLEGPRLSPPTRAASREATGVIVVHPERAEPAVVAGEAWHLTAGHMDRFVEGPWGRSLTSAGAGEPWSATAQETAA